MNKVNFCPDCGESYLLAQSGDDNFKCLICGFSNNDEFFKPFGNIEEDFEQRGFSIIETV